MGLPTSALGYIEFVSTSASPLERDAGVPTFDQRKWLTCGFDDPVSFSRDFPVARSYNESVLKVSFSVFLHGFSNGCAFF